MKKSTHFLFTVCFLGFTGTVLRAQVAINNSATNPDASAILDLKTGNAGVNKGFLPQSVALTNVTTAAPVTSPATGLIVYSSTAPAGGFGVGYYYWNGSAWVTLGAPMSLDNLTQGTGISAFTYNGSSPATVGIANTTVTAGNYGTATMVPTYTVNAQGQLTGAANVAISAVGIGAVTGTGTNNYVARWTPSSTNIGTGMIQDNGSEVGVDNAPVAGTMVYVNGGTGQAIEGFNTGSSDAIYGNSPNWVGVYGFASSFGDIGVWGENDATDGFGTYGTSTNGTGAYGYSNATNGYGVYAYNGAAGGTGLWSYGDTGISSIGAVNGINAYGVTYGINDTGFVGENAEGAGGIQALGTGYQGVEGTGASYGVYAIGNDVSGLFGGVYAYDATTGYGVQSASANGEGVNSTGATYGVFTTTSDPFGFYAGVFGEDDNSYGVEGYSTSANGGYFSDGNGDYGVVANNANSFGGWFFDAAGDWTRAGDGLDGSAAAFENSTGTYMIVCQGGTGFVTNGTKSTEVKGNDGKTHLLYCNESPEVMFEDYGEGQLVNGKVHISLDPLFAKNVAINDKHPLRVYIELLGDCNGTYVTNRSASGFDVIELKHATSNKTYQWHKI